MTVKGARTWLLDTGVILVVRRVCGALGLKIFPVLLEKGADGSRTVASVNASPE